MAKGSTVIMVAKVSGISPRTNTWFTPERGDGIAPLLFSPLILCRCNTIVSLRPKQRPRAVEWIRSRTALAAVAASPRYPTTLIGEIGPTARRAAGRDPQIGRISIAHFRQTTESAARGKKDEGGQPNGDVGAALAEKPVDAIGIGEAEQDCQGNYGNGNEACQHEYEPVSWVGNCRLRQPDADDDGD